MCASCLRMRLIRYCVAFCQSSLALLEIYLDNYILVHYEILHFFRLQFRPCSDAQSYYYHDTSHNLVGIVNKI